MPLSTGITYSLIDKGTADQIPIVSIGYGRTDASDGRGISVCISADHELLAPEHRQDQVSSLRRKAGWTS